MANDEALFAFGKAVRERRGELHLSQERLAEASGLHRTYIGAVERGERNPTLQTICRLADGLQLSLTSLIERTSGYLSPSATDRRP